MLIIETIYATFLSYSFHIYLMESIESPRSPPESLPHEEVLYKYMHILKKLEIIICIGIQSGMVTYN